MRMPSARTATATSSDEVPAAQDSVGPLAFSWFGRAVDRPCLRSSGRIGGLRIVSIRSRAQRGRVNVTPTDSRQSAGLAGTLNGSTATCLSPLASAVSTFTVRSNRSPTHDEPTLVHTGRAANLRVSHPLFLSFSYTLTRSLSFFSTVTC